MADRAVVLAVGSSTHQSQLIYTRPRAMLPVLGKPLVARAMERLYRAGIRKFTVVLGNEEGAVAAYLNSHWFANVSLDFVIQPNHRNLAQSLSDIVKQDDQPFILAPYNSITHSNFPEHLLTRYQDNYEDLIIAAAPTSLSKSKPTDFALVENQVIKAISREMPSNNQQFLLLMGLSWCGARFVHFLAERVSTARNQIADIFRDYIEAGGKALAAETAWILPVETDFDLLTVNKLLLNDGQDTHILSEIPRNVEIIPPVRIDPQVSIAVGAKIGPGVYLESGCSIGPNVVLNNAVVLENATVSANSNRSDVVISSRATIRV